jgi:hypothetical protein
MKPKSCWNFETTNNTKSIGGVAFTYRKSVESVKLLICDGISLCHVP